MEVTRAWQVMSAIHGYIATHKDKDGNLPIKDDKTGEILPLEFVEMHLSVRHLKKEGEYFALHPLPQAWQSGRILTDIDFWVNQKTGKLQVDNVKVHKVPVQEDGVWRQVPRYTFDGMDIEENSLRVHATSFSRGRRIRRACTRYRSCDGRHKLIHNRSVRLLRAPVWR